MGSIMKPSRVWTTCLRSRIVSLTVLFVLAAVFGGLCMASAPVQGAGPPGWQPLPSPGPGDITTLAVHPTNPNLLFVGTDAAGAWYSTDGGGSWTISDTYINHTAAAAIAPSDPSHVYLAASWAEIFVSHDGGVTFPGDPLTPPNKV